MMKSLEKLGAKPASLHQNILIASLNNLEKTAGRLPESYRRFLLHYGVSVLFDVNVVFRGMHPSPWADDKGYDSLESFYGLAESGKEYTVFEAAETYQADLHDRWLPIGSSSGNNQICLCLTGPMSGQIWFWDHEADPVFTGDKVISGMTKITNSFVEFVNTLEIEEDKLDSSGVIKVELDF